MTLHFQTKDLRDAVQQLQPVLSSKQTLPVLGAVEINLDPDGKLLRCTNTDVFVGVDVGCNITAQVGQGEAVRVPGKLLYEALSRISAETCQISTTDAHAVLTAGNAKLKLPLIVDPMPQLPEAEWSKPFTVQGLQEKLAKCLKFSSRDPSRWLINSVYLGNGKMEAQDGRRAIRITVEGLKAHAIVPNELAAMIAKTEGEVQIRTAQGLVEFSGEGWTITGKQIESTTGEWAPSLDRHKCAVIGRIKTSASELIEASKLATFGVSDTAITPVRFRLNEEGNLILHTDGEQPGEAQVDAESDFSQPWAVNARFLEIALQAMPQDEVELELSDVNSFGLEQQDTKVAVALMRVS